jgi:hypothetical protein
MKHRTFLSIMILIFTLILAAAHNPSPVEASHSWGDYHWARMSNPFTLKLGDNLTSNWDPILATTSTDWSASTILDTSIVTGNANPKRCNPTSGRIEVCNSKYGNNGWLGIAQVWVSGTHITQAVTKINDTYFTKPAYNTDAWKNLVMCQEVGHVFGLDHQDEDFANANLNTCMDYTNTPSTNQHPNAHDYAQLESIYAHLDTFNSFQSLVTQKLPLGLSVSAGSQDISLENRADWGKTLKDNGNVALFERDLGRGNKVFTFTIWAEGEHKEVH